MVILQGFLPRRAQSLPVSVRLRPSWVCIQSTFQYRDGVSSTPCRVFCQYEPTMPAWTGVSGPWHALCTDSSTTAPRQLGPAGIHRPGSGEGSQNSWFLETASPRLMDRMSASVWTDPRHRSHNGASDLLCFGRKRCRRNQYHRH